jgi:hypothetical protein
MEDKTLLSKNKQKNAQQSSRLSGFVGTLNEYMYLYLWEQYLYLWEEEF